MNKIFSWKFQDIFSIRMLVVRDLDHLPPRFCGGSHARWYLLAECLLKFSLSVFLIIHFQIRLTELHGNASHDETRVVYKGKKFEPFKVGDPGSSCQQISSTVLESAVRRNRIHFGTTYQ